MKEIIIKCIDSVEDSFKKEELAFLALTSKIEIPIRDRLAYNLFIELNPKYIISREWLRTDIAILEDAKPKALIEMKAMYSFDALITKNLLNYKNKLMKDVEKVKKLSLETTELYTILLATHPTSIIDTKYEKTVKYLKDVNRGIRNYENINLLKINVFKNVKEKFNNWEMVQNGSLLGGKAYEIETEVLYWVFKI